MGLKLCRHKSNFNINLIAKLNYFIDSIEDVTTFILILFIVYLNEKIISLCHQLFN